MIFTRPHPTQDEWALLSPEEITAAIGGDRAKARACVAALAVATADPSCDPVAIRSKMAAARAVLAPPAAFGGPFVGQRSDEQRLRDLDAQLTRTGAEIREIRGRVAADAAEAAVTKRNRDRLEAKATLAEGEGRKFEWSADRKRLTIHPFAHERARGATATVHGLGSDQGDGSATMAKGSSSARLDAIATLAEGEGRRVVWSADRRSVTVHPTRYEVERGAMPTTHQ